MNIFKWLMVKYSYAYIVGRNQWENQACRQPKLLPSPGCPLASLCGCVVVRGAAAPKQPITFTQYVNASMLKSEPERLRLSLKAGIWALMMAFLASRLWFEPQGWDFWVLRLCFCAFRLESEPQALILSPKAGIWSSRLISEPQGWNLSLMNGVCALRLGFEPQDWELSLEHGVWVLWQEFEPWVESWASKGVDGQRRRRKERNFPYVWKHRSSAPLEPLPKKCKSCCMDTT